MGWYLTVLNDSIEVLGLFVMVMLNFYIFFDVRESLYHHFMLMKDGLMAEQVITLGVVVHNILGEVRPVVFVEVELIENALFTRHLIFFSEHTQI